MFKKRLDGSVDFYLNWSDYKVGFGDMSGEFWLGLDKIYRLTSDDNSMLRVDLEDFDGNIRFAEYNMFGVTNENDKYKLNLGSYSGDSLCFQTLCLLKNHFFTFLTPDINEYNKLQWLKTTARTAESLRGEFINTSETNEICHLSFSTFENELLTFNSFCIHFLHDTLLLKYSWLLYIVFMVTSVASFLIIKKSNSATSIIIL